MSLHTIAEQVNVGYYMAYMLYCNDYDLEPNNIIFISRTLLSSDS